MKLNSYAALLFRQTRGNRNSGNFPCLISNNSRETYFCNHRIDLPECKIPDNLLWINFHARCVPIVASTPRVTVTQFQETATVLKEKFYSRLSHSTKSCTLKLRGFCVMMA